MSPPGHQHLLIAKNNRIFQSWMKILPTPYRPAFETLLKTNSTFTGPKLHSWIDSGIYLNSKFSSMVVQTQYILFLKSMLEGDGSESDHLT